jgi:hypothetical protein
VYVAEGSFAGLRERRLTGSAFHENWTTRVKVLATGSSRGKPAVGTAWPIDSKGR